MKKVLAAAAAGALLTGCAGMSPELQQAIQGVATQTVGTPQALTEGEIASGLKEALETGTARAIRRIGVPDGFWLNRDLNIPLPDNLKKAEKALRALGQARMVDEFHLSMNRAAEAAVPEAASIFATAIRGMTLADARTILNGPGNAATEYFRQKTSGALFTRFKPIVMNATSSVGATRKYKDLTGKVAKYVSNFQMQDLDAYVTERALAGLFRTLAEEEQRIRVDPGARTSELLKKVFGAKPY